ncbi:hypothetical protein EV182_001165 [Spiromyces aspiralis]|uniref:Uncharacterized protein n=1 Tax=Spiromyces aspiralis TaxID=68401 RepID=A0ACC1HJD4_9FUNG|nr:hypothetical protein EV182_001165 [Spiromyces aspiralis]
MGGGSDSQIPATLTIAERQRDIPPPAARSGSTSEVEIVPWQLPPLYSTLQRIETTLAQVVRSMAELQTCERGVVTSAAASQLVAELEGCNFAALHGIQVATSGDFDMGMSVADDARATPGPDTGYSQATAAGRDGAFHAFLSRSRIPPFFPWGLNGAARQIKDDQRDDNTAASALLPTSHPGGDAQANVVLETKPWFPNGDP